MNVKETMIQALQALVIVVWYILLLTMILGPVVGVFILAYLASPWFFLLLILIPSWEVMVLGTFNVLDKFITFK